MKLSLLLLYRIQFCQVISTVSLSVIATLSSYIHACLHTFFDVLSLATAMWKGDPVEQTVKCHENIGHPFGICIFLFCKTNLHLRYCVSQQSFFY